jgi:hypothetical protein
MLFAEKYISNQQTSNLHNVLKKKDDAYINDNFIEKNG